MLDLPDLLKQYSARIDDLLAREIPPDAYPYISGGVWYQFSGGGKRLRPALCLITCDALGGDPQTAMPFALATEVLHNFFLIHDDIEDGDTMRRDQETLWVKLGVPNAINVGDFLIAKAYQLILNTPLPPGLILELANVFSTTFERTVEGQALDINLRGNSTVTLETYFRIVELKTAYYLALPLVGGALIAGLERSTVESLWGLGRCLGPAFQMRDDLLDLTEGKGRGGEIGCDLREGKPSVFFAYVFDRAVGTETERGRLQEIVAKPRSETTPQDVDWAIRFYHRSGAIEFAKAEAQAMIDRAQVVLETIPLPAAGKEVFRSICRFIIDRNS